MSWTKTYSESESFISKGQNVSVHSNIRVFERNGFLKPERHAALVRRPGRTAPATALRTTVNGVQPQYRLHRTVLDRRATPETRAGAGCAIDTRYRARNTVIKFVLNASNRLDAPPSPRHTRRVLCLKTPSNFLRPYASGNRCGVIENSLPKYNGNYAPRLRRGPAVPPSHLPTAAPPALPPHRNPRRPIRVRIVFLGFFSAL